MIRKHRDRAEAMIERFQEASRVRLRQSAAVPADHPVWTVGGWRTFLSSPKAVRAAVQYVEKNPAKSGLATQFWTFVKPYYSWPFHKHG